MHLSKPTKIQFKVAKKLGVSLRGASQSISAARIHDAVEAAIAPGSSPRAPTEKQTKFARDLGVYRPGDTFRVCSARIDEELFRRNRAALRKLRLKPGDSVTKTCRIQLSDRTKEVITRHVVSSIGANLRVYFKNPGDSGGWPSQLAKEPDTGLGGA